MASKFAAGLISAILVANGGEATEAEHVRKQWRTMQQIEKRRDPDVTGYVGAAAARSSIIDVRPRTCIGTTVGKLTMLPLCYPKKTSALRANGGPPAGSVLIRATLGLALTHSLVAGSFQWRAAS
jgi:hypothetical protein